MEILLQIILEPLFFAYYDLVEYFIDGKEMKKWQEYLLKISCLIISLTSFFLVLIGSFWVTDVNPFKTYGIIFLIVGGVVLFAHIIIGLFVGTNHFIEEKRNEEYLDYTYFEENEPTPQVEYVKTNNDEQKYYVVTDNSEDNEK